MTSLLRTPGKPKPTTTNPKTTTGDADEKGPYSPKENQAELDATAAEEGRRKGTLPMPGEPRDPTARAHRALLLSVRCRLLRPRCVLARCVP